MIEVSHLPPAASFYAAITQPLGIQYLSASPQGLHFGYISETGPVCIFTLQQSAVFPPPSSHITLLAQSPAAINSFYKKSLLANSAQKDHSLLEVDGEIKARTADLDGNMLEAVYSNRGGPMIETASTAKEARRVLEWQEEVARSVAASDDSPSSSTVSGSTVKNHDHRPAPPYRRAESYPSVQQFPTAQNPRSRLVRRETYTTEHYGRPDDTRDAGGSGFNGMKLVGTLLGAAAGAAVAYAMVRSESPTRLSAPPRRASYAGDTHSHSHAHTTYGPVVERIPARSYVSRDAEQPPYVAQYTIAAPSHMERIDERSHVSQRTGRSERHSARERSRSEAGSASRYDKPLTILPAPAPSHVSHVSHVSHRSHKSSLSDEKRTPSRKDSDSYVSARSHASKRTGDVKYIGSSPPPSHSTTTTIRVIPKDERRSVVSARNVPLPESRVGGYAASVAPSDSVSSVGTKRERERLRDRLRERY